MTSGGVELAVQKDDVSVAGQCRFDDVTGGEIRRELELRLVQRELGAGGVLVLARLRPDISRTGLSDAFLRKEEN